MTEPKIQDKLKSGVSSDRRPESAESAESAVSAESAESAVSAESGEAAEPGESHGPPGESGEAAKAGESSKAGSRSRCCPSWDSIEDLFHPPYLKPIIQSRDDVDDNEVNDAPIDFKLTAKNAILHGKPVYFDKVENWDFCFSFPEEVLGENDTPVEASMSRRQKRKNKNKLMKEDQVRAMWEAISPYKATVDDVGVHPFYNTTELDFGEMYLYEHKRKVYRAFMTSLKSLGIETKQTRGVGGGVFVLARMSNWAAAALAKDSHYYLQLDRRITNVEEFRQDPSFMAPYTTFDDTSEDPQRGWLACKELGRVFARYDKVSRPVLLKDFDTNGPEVTLFRDIDRARLTLRLLSTFYNLSKMEKEKYLINYLFLHQLSNQSYLEQNWARFGLMFTPDQPLPSIRSYYGEESGFWFAWLSSLCGNLWLPSVIGLAVSIVQAIIDPMLTFTQSASNMIGVAYAAYIVLWTLYFHQSWERIEDRLRLDWGMDQITEVDLPRAEFKYDHLTPNPANPAGPPLKREKKWKTVLRYLFTTFIFALCCAVVVLIVLTIFLVQVLLWKLSSMTYTEIFRVGTTVVVPYYFDLHPSGELIDKIEEEVERRQMIEGMSDGDPDGGGHRFTVPRREPAVYSDFTTAASIAVLVFIFENIWRLIAVALCNFENHQYNKTWKESLSMKIFFFGVVNHFNYLLFVAFVKPHVVAGICPTAGCMGSLRVTTVAMVMVYFLLNVLTTLIGMWWTSRRLRLRKRARESAATGEASVQERLESQLDLGTIGPEDQIAKWNEMSLQFWLISLFSVAFPGICFLAWIIDMFKLRLEAHNFNSKFRRPFPAAARGVGAWGGFMALAQPASIAVNCAICVFNLPVGGSIGTVWKFVFFIILEHVLLTVLAALTLKNSEGGVSMEVAREKCQAVLNEAMWGHKETVVNLERPSTSALASSESLAKPGSGTADRDSTMGSTAPLTPLTPQAKTAHRVKPKAA
eukprot:GHVN01083273.1.p1 GENE.GHVN01083273.1~~GHVN01083273.1.p1  ORF type:complete len:976 (+),score=120.45 GHVN01083273.1:212-3139(+)